MLLFMPTLSSFSWKFIATLLAHSPEGARFRILNQLFNNKVVVSTQSMAIIHKNFKQIPVYL
jgi:hypothetical protein